MKTTTLYACLLIFAALLTACSPGEEPTQATQPELSKPDQAQAKLEDTTQAFRQFLQASYAEDMDRYPLTASFRGIKSGNDLWNDYSVQFAEQTRNINQQRLDRLLSFDRNALGPEDALSFDLYRLDLERRMEADEYRLHRYVIHQHRGPHTQVPSSLINIHRVNQLSDAEDYLGRLNQVGVLFDQVIEQLRLREAEGFFLADWQYEKIIEASANVLSGAPFEDDARDSTLMADFRAKVIALDLGEQQTETLLSQANTALTQVVKPAYGRLMAELQAQSKLASGDDGVWKFSDGDDFYAERLRWFTTTDISADQVHQLGLSEVDRIHRQMRDIMVTVNFDGDLQDFFRFMREDERFYYPNTDAGRQAYLDEATRLIDLMRARLPEAFGLLPRAEMVVKRVEPFRERSAGKAFYQGPPPDGSRPGIYYANLFDMKQMPIYQMEALAYHEGVPGHHMQRAISVELTGIPDFQKYASFTAYTEGWGLYTEQLPKEMGFYQDPYSDFGRLAMELWRACRLVVDTGLHHKRWTREEAIDYLVNNTPNPERDAVKAIERYIAMPGQATAYTIGKLKILELRERARMALGDQFDIRQFHDLVLESGPVPLSILEQRVDTMISNRAATAGL